MAPPENVVNSIKRRLPAAILPLAVLAACSDAPDPPAPQPPAAGTSAPAPQSPPAESAAPGEAEAPPAPAIPAQAGFSAGPEVGQIIRANCRMGGCWWNRVDAVTRSGPDSAPRYALTLAGGESSHGQDPYPEDAQGVEIEWDAKPMQATISCSRTAPKTAFDGDERIIKLNPQGVSGVEQGVASLYFAVCHGNAGPDSELAATYGYDVK